MHLLHRPAFTLSRRATIGLIAALSLCASNAAYSQTEIGLGSPPGISAPASDGVHDAAADLALDSAREAAIVRMVRAMGIYPFARQMWMNMFGSPEEQNDPKLERFIDETLPEKWVCESLAKMFKSAMTGLSPKEIDEATRFFQSPVGKKYMALSFRQLKNGGQFDLSAEKWTPAERSAITRFAYSPVGLASAKMMSGQAAHAFGEKLGAERMKDLLSDAQIKFAGMGDIDFQVEADRVHDGSSPAGVVEQLAVIKEYNERAGKRQADAIAEVKPIVARFGTLQAKDILAQQNFAQLREDVQKIEDTFNQSVQSVQQMITFSMESMAVLPAPQKLKTIWQSALEAGFNAASHHMSDMTLAVHDVTSTTRELLDFLDAHKANITINKDGKLIFANNADLASFQDIAARLDASREKLRNIAQRKSS